MAIFSVTKNYYSNKSAFNKAVKQQLTPTEIDLILPFVDNCDSNYYVEFITKQFLRTKLTTRETLSFNKSLMAQNYNISFIIERLDYRINNYFDYIIYIYKK